MPAHGFPVTKPEVLEYVKRLAEAIHKRRRNPVPAQSGSVLRDGWWERDRRIFSDTHPVTRDLEGRWPSYLNETRREALRDCPDCPGLLVIDTSSEVCLGGRYVKLPHDPCPRCLSLAEDIKSGAKLH
jgi:hypothetical protein